MKQILLIVVVLTFLAVSLPPVADADPHESSSSLTPEQLAFASTPACKDKQKSLNAAFSKLVPPAELFKPLLTPSNQVMILGESHDTNSQAVEPGLLRTIRELDPRYDCLYVVFSKATDLRPGDPYFGLVHAAAREGFKVWYVDQIKTAFQADRFMNTQTRSLVIADEIEKSFESHACSAGVLIIGKTHLYSELISSPGATSPTAIESVSMALAWSGVRNQSVNLLNLDVEDERLEPRPGAVYRYTPNRSEIFSPACPVTPPKIASPAGFDRAKVPRRLPYDPANGGLFGDFAATILVP